MTPGKSAISETFSALGQFISYYGPHKKMAALDLIAILARSGLTVLIPVIVYRIFERYLPGGNFTAIALSSAVLLGVTVALSGAEYVCLRWGHILGARMEASMRNDIFGHLQKLSFSFFDRAKTGHLMSRISNDLTMLAETAHHVPEDLLVSTLTMAGAFAVMFSINPLLAGITLIPLPFIIVWGSVFQGRMRRAFRGIREKVAEINRQVENSIQGVREVKSFNNEAAEIDKFRRVNGSFLAEKEGAYRVLAVFHSGVTFLIQSYSLLFIGAGALLACHGKTDLAQIIAFFMYSRYITMPMMRLLQLTEQFQQASAAFDHFREVMAEHPDMLDAPDAVSPPEMKGHIRLERVDFAYPGRPDIPVLNGVDMDIPAGTTVALVGESGAGKSTIAALIPRFYDISGGSISVDGIEIRQYKQSYLRRNIGIVLQTPFLFDATIRENIRFGRPGATDSEVLEAAREANVLEFAEHLLDGLDTSVGERGVKLSGGQRQRISIARVFLKNPPILIFDEATSSLDNESEEMIRKSMEVLCRNRTALIIAHRLSTVKHADRIFCIRDGRMVESGSQQELLQTQTYFRKLYEMHSF